MTPAMWIALLAWALIAAGYVCRRNRRRHVPLVLSGILIDITLVGYLQFTRHAVQTAFEFKLNWMQQAHIWCSTTALVLYFPVLWLGFRLLNGDESIRQRHRSFAIPTLLFRTLGVIFMFSMWKGD